MPSHRKKWHQQRTRDCGPRHCVGSHNMACRNARNRMSVIYRDSYSQPEDSIPTYAPYANQGYDHCPFHQHSAPPSTDPLCISHDDQCQTEPFQILVREYCTVPPGFQNLFASEAYSSSTPSQSEIPLPPCFMSSLFEEPPCYEPFCPMASVQSIECLRRRSSRTVCPRRSVSFNCFENDCSDAGDNRPLPIPTCELFSRKSQTECPGRSRRRKERRRESTSPAVACQTENDDVDDVDDGDDIDVVDTKDKKKSKRNETKRECHCETSTPETNVKQSRQKRNSTTSGEELNRGRKSKKDASNSDVKDDKSKRDSSTSGERLSKSRNKELSLEKITHKSCDPSGDSSPDSAEDLQPYCCKKRKHSSVAGNEQSACSTEDSDYVSQGETCPKSSDVGTCDLNYNNVKENQRKTKSKSTKTRKETKDASTCCECLSQSEDCNCHYPPAFNQIVCAGNIIGDCHCDNSDQ